MTDRPAAPCKGLGDLFNSTDPADHAEARKICATCITRDCVPIFDWIAEHAQDRPFITGTWDGRLYSESIARYGQRTCRLDECDLPLGGHGSARYCSDEHKNAAAWRRRQEGAA